MGAHTGNPHVHPRGIRGCQDVVCERERRGERAALTAEAGVDDDVHRQIWEPLQRRRRRRGGAAAFNRCIKGCVAVRFERRSGSSDPLGVPYRGLNAEARHERCVGRVGVVEEEDREGEVGGAQG